jgi:hypothetical protein
MRLRDFFSQLLAVASQYPSAGRVTDLSLYAFREVDGDLWGTSSGVLELSPESDPESDIDSGMSRLLPNQGDCCR